MAKKKSSAPAATANEPKKVDLICGFLEATGKTTKNKEVIAHFEKLGVKVAGGEIINAKKKLKWIADDGETKTEKKHQQTMDFDFAEAIRSARELADTVGGFDKAIEALNIVQRIGSTEQTKKVLEALK